ncbi:MAG TPA: zinc ABC transporter substrate-binding protein [Clostridiales bacterium]|nr:zinc ABC transporter substrate-binding protein [Clostridiales bacterium]
MRKTITLFMALAFICLCLSGCAGGEAGEADGRLHIIATNFPSYDFARQVCGNLARVSMLLPPGTESHSYEPSAQDIINIQNCDLFIYTGGLNDSWVEDILASLDRQAPALKMMDCVSSLKEELKEGMDDHDHGHHEEYDQHVWTSPVNAILIVRAIEGALCDIDPENRKAYAENSEDYISRLKALDQSYREFFSTALTKTLVFGDRFPFRYFAEEYGLDYYAAFPGCSSEAEPSAATVAFLIDKVREEGVRTVFYIEFSNHLVADSIAEATGAETALLHSCHNVTRQELEEGVSYISLMERNLETLKGALD